MSLRATITRPDIARTIAGSRAAIEAITDGTDPLIAAAEVLVNIMKDLLSQPGQGRLYVEEFRFSRALGRPIPIGVARPPHRASAPGQPPATDRGILRAAVGFDRRGKNKVGIGVNRSGFFWFFLEFGTAFVMPRPFVRPAVIIGDAAMADEFRAKVTLRARQFRR